MPSDDPIKGPGPPAPLSQQDSGPSPLGVPKGYTIPRTGRHAQGADAAERQGRAGTYQYDQGLDPYDSPTRRTYYTGDEMIPANWPAPQIWQLQQALAKVGLLTGTFTRHTWDNASQNAYAALLSLANAQGIDADRALMDLLNSAGAEEGGQRYKTDEFGNVVPVGTGQEPAPLVTRTTDPAQLRQTFRRAVIEMLGEGWSTAEIDKMVAAYNGVEVSRQTQAYNMDLAGEGGSITSIPSPEAFIQQQVLEKDPVGVQTEEALGFTSQFMDTINSPAWGVG